MNQFLSLTPPHHYSCHNAVTPDLPFPFVQPRLFRLGLSTSFVRSVYMLGCRRWPTWFVPTLVRIVCLQIFFYRGPLTTSDHVVLGLSVGSVLLDPASVASCSDCIRWQLLLCTRLPFSQLLPMFHSPPLRLLLQFLYLFLFLFSPSSATRRHGYTKYLKEVLQLV